MVKKSIFILMILMIALITIKFFIDQRQQENVNDSLAMNTENKIKYVEEKSNIHYNPNKNSSASIFGGHPKAVSYPNRIKILNNIGFVVGYDEVRKDPAWVSYRIFKDKIERGPKRPSRFMVDDRTEAKVSHDDYTKSGYDRGHMAPNWAIALRYGPEAQIETFLMSNIVPQSPNLNQGPWRELEEVVCKIYGNDLEEVWITTGPIFDKRIEKLPSGIEIPDEFYKIIVDVLPNQEIRVMAFLMPQNIAKDAFYGDYLVSVDMVEEKSGLDFMSELRDDEEELLEMDKLSKPW